MREKWEIISLHLCIKIWLFYFRKKVSSPLNQMLYINFVVYKPDNYINISLKTLIYVSHSPFLFFFITSTYSRLSSAIDDFPSRTLSRASNLEFKQISGKAFTTRLKVPFRVLYFASIISLKPPRTSSSRQSLCLPLTPVHMPAIPRAPVRCARPPDYKSSYRAAVSPSPRMCIRAA